MAQTFTLKSHSYDGRYLELRCTQTRDVATNSSLISWTLSAKGGDSNAYTTGPTTVKIGGTTAYYKAKTSYNSGDFPAVKGSASGEIRLPHEQDGTLKVQVSIKTNIYTGVLKTTEGTWTLDANERYAWLQDAPDFTDEEDLTLTYTAPDDLQSLTAILRLGTEDLICRENTATFLFSQEERTLLRSKIPDATRLSLTAVLQSVRGGVSYESTLPVTMTVIPAAPVVAVSVTDMNPTVTAVTGISKMLVPGFSRAQVSVHAQGQKGASIQSIQVRQGNRIFPGSCILSPVGEEPIQVTVRDSRGWITAQKAQVNILPYTVPTCRVVPAAPTGQGDLTLTVTGSYYPSSLGVTPNTLQVAYQYRAVTDSDFGPWQTMTVSKTGNAYTAQAALQLPDYRNTYLIRARATDVLTQTVSEEQRFVAMPVFDWSGEDFRFHVPVQFQGKSLLDFCYPVNSIYISYSHQNPGELFGGLWERLTDAFLWAAGADDPIGPTQDGQREVTLTTDTIPAHTHQLNLTSTAGTGSYSTSHVAYTKSGGTTYCNDNAFVASGGQGLPHNNMPPYMNVSVWRRIA